MGSRHFTFGLLYDNESLEFSHFAEWISEQKFLFWPCRTLIGSRGEVMIRFTFGKVRSGFVVDPSGTPVNQAGAYYAYLLDDETASFLVRH